MSFKSFIGGALLLLLVVSGNGQETRLFVVLKDKKWGFMDREGKIVIPFQFEYASPFSEGLAQVVTQADKDESIGYIDPHGAFVIPPKYYRAGSFSEGLAPVAFKTGRTKPCVDCSTYDWKMQWGFIDKTGRLKIAARFRNAMGMHEGLAAVQDDSGRWGFVDPSGALVIPFSFDYATYFSDGLAPVMMGEFWGQIDKSGQWAVPPRFTSARSFHEGKAIVKIGGTLDRRECGLPCPLPSGGAWRVIDRKGPMVITVPAELIFHDFSEGLLAWHDGKHCGYVAIGDAHEIPPQWSACADFSEGLARVEKSGRTYYIDADGKKIISSPTREAFDFHNGLAQVGQWWPDGDWQGYIDHNGRLVWSSSGALPAKKKNRN